MRISPRTKIKTFDIDGNTLHVFMGYDMPTTDAVFAVSDAIVGMTLTYGNRPSRIVRRVT